MMKSLEYFLSLLIQSLIDDPYYQQSIRKESPFFFVVFSKSDAIYSVIFTTIRTFRAFIEKNIKILFYISFFLAIKEWEDLLRGGELNLYKLVVNTAVAFYFWCLSVGKFEFR